MCGVIAYNSERPGPGDIEMLKRLFVESGIRGLHSCGYVASFDEPIKDTWNGRGDNVVVKSFGIGALNETLMESAAGAKRLIGHTRYSTSGDWENHNNNQPLVVGEISLAFNGCIHMGLRQEYEAVYGKTYVTDNDGEIFARKVLDGEDWEKFVAEGTFSFAGAFLFKKALWVIRNRNRPLWTAKRGPSTFVASTRDILARAGLKQGSRVIVEEVPACRALQL